MRDIWTALTGFVAGAFAIVIGIAWVFGGFVGAVWAAINDDLLNRRWRISRKEVEALATSHDIALDPENNAENAEMQMCLAAGSEV